MLYNRRNFVQIIAESSICHITVKIRKERYYRALNHNSLASSYNRVSVNIVFPAIVDIKTILFVAGIISGINAGCNSPYVGKIVVKIILYIVRKCYSSIGNSRSFSLCFGRCCFRCRCCLHCSFGCGCCDRCCLRRCRCGIWSFGRLVWETSGTE